MSWRNACLIWGEAGVDELGVGEAFWEDGEVEEEGVAVHIECGVEEVWGAADGLGVAGTEEEGGAAAGV